jgi:hypothetical protein
MNMGQITEALNNTAYQARVDGIAPALSQEQGEGTFDELRYLEWAWSVKYALVFIANTNLIFELRKNLVAPNSKGHLALLAMFDDSAAHLVHLQRGLVLIVLPLHPVAIDIIADVVENLAGECK